MTVFSALSKPSSEPDPVPLMNITDAPVLSCPPVANVGRYDQLTSQEANHA